MTFRAKSELDWVIHRAKESPGPGECKLTQQPHLQQHSHYFSSDSLLSWLSSPIDNVKLPNNSGHTGKFPFVFKPTNPAQMHLAKGLVGVIKMNRLKKAVKAFSLIDAPSDQINKKRLRDMNEAEAAEFKKDLAASVERTRQHLARLEQKKRDAEDNNSVGSLVLSPSPSTDSGDREKHHRAATLLQKHAKKLNQKNELTNT